MKMVCVCHVRRVLFNPRTDNPLAIAVLKDFLRKVHSTFFMFQPSKSLTTLLFTDQHNEVVLVGASVCCPCPPGTEWIKHYSSIPECKANSNRPFKGIIQEYSLPHIPTNKYLSYLRFTLHKCNCSVRKWENIL